MEKAKQGTYQSIEPANCRDTRFPRGSGPGPSANSITLRPTARLCYPERTADLGIEFKETSRMTYIARSLEWEQTTDSSDSVGKNHLSLRAQNEYTWGTSQKDPKTCQYTWINEITTNKRKEKAPMRPDMVHRYDHKNNLTSNRRLKVQKSESERVDLRKQYWKRKMLMNVQAGEPRVKYAQARKIQALNIRIQEWIKCEKLGFVGKTFGLKPSIMRHGVNIHVEYG